MYFKDIISGLINYVRIQVNNIICILLAYNMLSFSTSFSGHPGRCNRLNISDRTRSYPSSHSSCPILLWRKTLPYNQRMFCIPPQSSKFLSLFTVYAAASYPFASSLKLPKQLFLKPSIIYILPSIIYIVYVQMHAFGTHYFISLRLPSPHYRNGTNCRIV